MLNIQNSGLKTQDKFISYLSHLDHISTCKPNDPSESSRTDTVPTAAKTKTTFEKVRMRK